MNKDLDNRLIPNGEYRDAQNISVGKSESDSIGSLENVLGNNQISSGSVVGAGNVIGTYSDEPNQLIYAFFSDNTASNLISSSVNHYIAVIRTDGGSFNNNKPWNILVQGSFLNFSTSFPIIGINLIEDLLFFTDNRNQPRVINVTNTLGYYTQESDIAVAKFSPFDPIKLFKQADTTSTTAQTSAVVAVADATGIEIGMTLISTSSVGVAKIEANEYIIVTAINGLNITISSSQAFATGDLLYFVATTMTNEDNNSTWPGDPNYLDNKFVRFSYRYRYSDGEYSTFAPFTQPAYIPKQEGYFLNTNEENAYRSTILDWMENSVQNVELLIPLPDIGINIDPRNSSPGSYKISEIDILYKESNGLVAKVLETIPSSAIRNDSPNSDFYSYNYQSSKPYKTLTEEQTIRVFDQIPVRALAQESSGNRIIYGNFFNRYSPPVNGIKYEVGVSQKRTTPNVNNWLEYPNSSLKQNRNYQVGIVLADKFGRQSSVILSNVISSSRTIDNVRFGSSTIFSPYNTSTESATQPVKDWFGDALQVYFDQAISTGTTTGDYISQPFALPNTTPVQIGSDPGLYAGAKNTVAGSAQLGFNVAGSPVTISTSAPFTFAFSLNATGGQNIPAINDYLRGEFIDYVKVISVVNNGATPPIYTVTCDGAINQELYSLSVPPAAPDAKFCYNLNQTGWYSYKIVVKQQEQDYYNAFLPGILNGYPEQTGSAVPFPIDETNETANIILLNDNINKIPRDLEEVGPDQKQFSSSVQLFGRVENTPTSNVQFFPTNFSDTVVNIETTDDSNMDPVDLTVIGQGNLYQLDTNPLVARVSTSKEIGVTTLTMVPHLAIYETEPVESLLDIYWETSTTGLISDLNADILSGFTGATGFSNFTFLLAEDTPIDNTLCSIDFKPVDSSGGQINKVMNSFSFTNDDGDPIPIILVQIDPNNAGSYIPVIDPLTYTGPWNLRATAVLPFNYTEGIRAFSGPPMERFKFSMNFEGTEQTFFGDLTNKPPVITPASLALLTKTQSDTGTLRTLTGVNGAGGTAAQQTESLFFTILSQTDAAGNAITDFVITGAGALTKDNGRTTPTGLYSVIIKLFDASDTAADGTRKQPIVPANQGGLSVNGTLPITIGSAGLSGGCISPCIDPSSGIQGQATNTVSITNLSPSTSENVKYNACWYISDNVLQASATPANNDFEGTGFPNISGLESNATVNANTGNPWHLGPIGAGAGSDQKTGTIVFNITMSQKKTSGTGGQFNRSSFDRLNIYSREADTTTWAPAKDLNDYQFLGLNNSPDQLSMELNTQITGNYTYGQYVFAFDTPVVGGNLQATEYAIVVTGLEVPNPDYVISVAEFPYLTVNSQDLFNDLCVLVPKAGTSAARNYGTEAVTTPKSFGYLIGTPSNVLNQASGGGFTGGTNTNFAKTAYGEYVKQYYSDVSLTTEVDWTVTGPGGSAYNGLNAPIYPWNAQRVTISTTPSFTPMTLYSQSLNFAANMTSGGLVNEGTVAAPNAGPWIVNFGSNPPVLNLGVTKALLRRESP